MRFAVTGGAGYIGSALIKCLVEDGDYATSIDNLMKGDYIHLKGYANSDNVKLIIGDIRDDDLLHEVFKDVDAVAHLAALPGLVQCRENPERAVSINVHGTYQVLDEARKQGVGRVVFCSSAAVYGTPVSMPVDEGHPLKPLNLYGVTKLAGEKLMGAFHANHDMETINLRFGNVYGVGMFTHWQTVIPKFVMQSLEGGPLTIFGDGKSSRDFVHVEDIVQAIILALKAEGVGGETFNVGGETVTIGNLAEIVSEELDKVTGSSVSAVHLPPRLGETKMFSYKIDKIIEMLGYRPKWSVRNGVKQIMDYRIKQLKDGG